MPYRRLYGRAGEVPYPVLVMGATNSGGKVLCDTDSECSATQALPCRVLDRYHPSVIVSVPCAELTGATQASGSVLGV
jgi:hypothetical protein